MPTRVALLASGAGSTAEAFIRACQAQIVDATVVLVICNKPEAGIFERLRGLNQEFGLTIKITLINAQTHPPVAGEQIGRGCQTAAEEAAIDTALTENNIALVLLMGYLRRIGPRLVDHYGWRPEYTSPYQARMLNTHPGLLPATKGLWGIHAQQYVIDHGLPIGGQTLHVVAEDYDDGPIIAEHQVAVEAGDDAETFFDRVQITEKSYLPVDVQHFLEAQKTYNSTLKEITV